MRKICWCCSGLEFAFDERKGQGIFVYATLSPEGKPMFWIAMRSVEKKDLGKIASIQPDDIPVTVTTRRPISYCPWCGVKLARFYRKRYEQLLDPSVASELENIP